MKEYIVVDLDGTLFDCSPRVDYAKASLWDDFHQRCLEDKPFLDVLELIQRIGPNMRVVACTGRNNRYRGITNQWFMREGALIDHLLMRPDDCYLPDTEIKIQLLEQFFGTKEKVLANVAFCLEDRDKVVEAFRNYGLPCWQVRQGTF